MATIRFEKSFAIKEATKAFLALNEACNTSITGVEHYEGVIVELRAQVFTKEDKMQFIKTAKTMISKGVEHECYYHRTIRKYCITFTWRIES